MNAANMRITVSCVLRGLWELEYDFIFILENTSNCEKIVYITF